MKSPVPASLAAAAAVAFLFLAARSPAPQDKEVAPFLTPGRAVYGLVTTQTTSPTLPERSAVEPVKILGVRGHWALVEVRGQTRGPVWINFDQVVSYRTDP